MQELLLVGNPAKRRAKSRKAPSPAQKRARAAFAAAARARSNPAKRKAKRRTAVAVATPHRAKRRTARKSVARARRNPATVANFSMRGIVPKLKHAAIGGLGAFGVDVAYGYLQSYLPDAVKSPVDLASGNINFAYYAAKGAAALGVGMIAARVIGASRAAHVVDASLTVTAHDLIKHFAASNLTSIPVAGRMGRATLQNMPGGKIVPQLPNAATLRKYVGSNTMSQYVNARSRDNAAH